MNEADNNFVGKVAEDSRTPKPRGRSGLREIAPASWSAAVLCRFFWRTTTVLGIILLLIVTGFWLNSAFAAKKAAPHIASDPDFTTIVNRINLAFEKSWQ